MKTSFRTKAASVGAATAVLLAVGTVTAGPEMSSKAPVQEMTVEEGWNICDVFDLAKIYKSDTGPINSLSFKGRYQGQHHWSDSNQVDREDAWENRRSRVGIKMGFLNDFAFTSTFNLNLDGDGRFFDSAEELYIAWEPNDNFYALAGKVKPKVTREYGISSRKIKTIERSQVVNQIVPDKIGGGVLGYTQDKLFLEAGLYAGSNSEDWLLPFDGSSSLAAIGRIGYDVTEATNVRFDYFYADGAGKDNAVEDYNHIFSLSSQSDWGRAHLITDLIYAKGIDDAEHSDVFGVVVMPYYDITDRLEGVLRYTYSTADSDNGIRLQSRYERETALDTRGDNYHAIYGGLNYYICDDKLKLMSGVEYSTMETASEDRYKNWTVFAGVRLYF